MYRVSLPAGVTEEVSEPSMVVAQVQAHTVQSSPILEPIEALDLSLLPQAEQEEESGQWLVVGTPQAQSQGSLISSGNNPVEVGSSSSAEPSRAEALAEVEVGDLGLDEQIE